MKNPLRRLIAAACLLVGTLVFAEESKPVGTAEDSSRLAQAWLQLVDNADYAESWKQAASRFRASVSQDRWVGMMNQVRQPLGSVSAREFTEATFTNEQPRAPKGNYWVVKFKTTFEAITANEVVTLTAEADGSWHVVGFFIRPAS